MTTIVADPTSTQPAFARPPRHRTDLEGALQLQAQKLERRFLAKLTLLEAEEAAKAAGVGRRQSVFVRDAESALAHAQRELEMAIRDVTLAIDERMQAAILAAIAGPRS